MLNTVFARDVQQTLDHFRRSVDRILGDNFASVSTAADSKQDRPTSEQVFSPVLESGWNENEMCVRAILPAVEPKDIQLSVRGNELVLEGQRQAPANWSKGAYTQLPYGRFYAAVTLPQGLDLERVNSRLHDGVLDITIPLAEQMRPRQIPIQSEGANRAISG
jgi:HSP20 family protein